jgi:CheY-like chemotaxis protein
MPRKILVIDDNAAMRQLLHETFTKHGYAVDETGNGLSGLTMAQTGGYAAILLDLRMPQMTGIEFLGKLKEKPPESPNGPIIVFSSQADDKSRDEVIKLGAAKFVEKTPDELIRLPEIITALTTA